ncbi:hypothetical protein F3K40_34610 [Streptomyces sp. LBUM 1478]|nr:hypothetical protein [Streptomyces sp. LBUM 1484]MBP5871482.1 hypothetical protein [Streptomyces sp. LBUM 1485]MBP5879927.1 hypothetical protein [Streptomyces sp. LBUM 1477]MBP5887755.1 hypothetical protein [Streptomyces sp. LBUM 1487]MBP5889666.1 hypothetical protein [Streptomyces sp. LBUM 1481]MBP5903761.1 hypothetical protein [Streptomyces sp. LBUM 1488]MBP5909672.1 hypothetical protein [Streptomyces sp. LBUM 1478]MBP5912537.1 hypothetical protein [Streptomyces sp. LBUM 1486]MBP591968
MPHGSRLPKDARVSPLAFPPTLPFRRPPLHGPVGPARGPAAPAPGEATAATLQSGRPTARPG